MEYDYELEGGDKFSGKWAPRSALELRKVEEADAEDAGAAGSGAANKLVVDANVVAEEEVPTAKDEPLPVPAAESSVPAYARRVGAAPKEFGRFAMPAASAQPDFAPPPAPVFRASENELSSAQRGGMPLTSGVKLEKLGGRWSDAATGAPRLLVVEEWRPSVQERAFLRGGYRQ